MSQNKLKRPLLFSATAFLFLYPICMAEVATGATSSFGLQQRTQLKPQTATATQQQSLPKTSQGQLQSALESPSFSQSLESLQSTLNNLRTQLQTLDPQIADKSKLAPARALLTTLQSQIDEIKRLSARYTADTILLKSAVERYETAKLAKATALTNYQTATTNNETALSELEAAQEVERQALLALNSKKSASSQAAQNLTSANEALDIASAVLTAELDALNAAQAAYDEAIQIKQSALTAQQAAQAAYDQALANYNNNLIPDPTWTMPMREEVIEHQIPYTVQVPYTETVTTTTLVPRTVYTTTGGVLAEVFNRLGYNNAPPLPTASETPVYTEVVSNIDFQWGGGQILNSGYYEDVIVRFTGNIVVPTSGNYQFYTPADDGTNLNINGTELINDWFDKGGGGSISQSIYLEAGTAYPFTLHYYENGGGANVWLYYYQPATGFQLVPTEHLGTTVEETTVYDEVTTTEEVTRYREETRYRIEYETILVPDTVTQTQTYTINEGGSLLITAPAGATFQSVTRATYEAVDNPQCYADLSNYVKGILLGNNSGAVSANNGIGGDPCPGWYKRLVIEATYTATPTAPLIHDPALFAILEQARLDNETVTITFNEATNSAAAAKTNLEQKQDNYASALLTKNEAASNRESAFTASQVAAQEQQAEQAVYDAAQEQLLIKTQNQNSSNLALTSSAAELEAATFNEETAAADQDKNYASTESSKKQYTDTFNEAIKTSAAAETSVSTLEPDPIPEPEPEPQPEPQPEELPEVISAEVLQEIDLTKIDPTTITEEQVAALQEAAYETFETAEQGSPEYEQALDALYLAAEADDIVVPEELAALPAIGPALAGAVELVNFLGNAGADMSPQVREESKKVVVTAVVAAGAAIQAAAGAATSAAVSTGSSGSRRIGK